MQELDFSSLEVKDLAMLLEQGLISEDLYDEFTNGKEIGE